MHVKFMLFTQKQSVDNDTRVGVRFIIVASGSGPVDTIMDDVEESLNRITAGLQRQQDECSHKS